MIPDYGKPQELTEKRLEIMQRSFDFFTGHRSEVMVRLQRLAQGHFYSIIPRSIQS